MEQQKETPIEPRRLLSRALVLSTADCRATVAELESRGVTVTEEPEELPWGVSAMIADPYGNEFNVMQAFRA